MATWTPPTTLATGQVLSSPVWNGVANDVTFLYQAPFLSMNLSATFPMGSGGYTAVGSSEIPMIPTFLNYGWSISEGQTAVVPVSGVYHFSFRVGFGNAEAGNSFALLFFNGNALIFGSTVPLFASFTGGIVSQSVGCGLLPCNAGDQIFLASLQNSGGDVNMIPGSAQTALEAFFVGSL